MEKPTDELCVGNALIAIGVLSHSSLKQLLPAQYIQHHLTPEAVPIAAVPLKTVQDGAGTPSLALTFPDCHDRSLRQSLIQQSGHDLVNLGHLQCLETRKHQKRPLIIDPDEDITKDKAFFRILSERLCARVLHLTSLYCGMEYDGSGKFMEVGVT